MLRVGVASTLGASISLPGVLQAEASAAGKPKKDVSLIILFLQGGLSTIDTLDLKPKAPAEFRGEFSPIKTNVAGIEVCEHLPRLAKTADKFALLRNFTHTNSGHGPADHWMLTGYAPRPGFNPSLKPNNQRPSHGSVIAWKKGPRGSVPPYVCLPKMHNSCGAAYLGSKYEPFTVNADPNAPNFSVPDLAPPLEIGSDRLSDRRALLSIVDRYRKSADVKANQSASALAAFQQKAFSLMTSSATKAAFDITQESDSLRERYGRHSLGQSCLMARRLVEAGVRCVTIDHTNWDTHYNNFHVLKTDLLPHLDSGLSTLLTDLADRRMLGDTLVVVMGEFGRTPRVNKDAGRDHWGPSNTILLAGGGITGGRVVGATNARGEKPAANPVGPADLAATMFHCLGINPDEEYHTPDGRPVTIVDGGKAIEALL
jgi:hypothetical protein